MPLARLCQTHLSVKKSDAFIRLGRPADATRQFKGRTTGTSRYWYPKDSVLRPSASGATAQACHMPVRSPLNDSDGIDILVVRELTAVLFGPAERLKTWERQLSRHNTCYTTKELSASRTYPSRLPTSPQKLTSLTRPTSLKTACYGVKSSPRIGKSIPMSLEHMFVDNGRCS